MCLCSPSEACAGWKPRGKRGAAGVCKSDGARLPVAYRPERPVHAALCCQRRPDTGTAFLQPSISLVHIILLTAIPAVLHMAAPRLTGTILRQLSLFYEQTCCCFDGLKSLQQNGNVWQRPGRRALYTRPVSGSIIGTDLRVKTMRDAAMLVQAFGCCLR